MTAAILCIGTELVRGEIVNTNATWLAERLTELGIEVSTIVEEPDDRARIEGALKRLGSEHAWIIGTGGLGPTTDDITSECVASALDVPLERDAASLEAIRARMSRHGRAMAASNEKQADFPRGAQVLPNPNGTAPGFSVRIGRSTAFFMPGVPSEMKPMFDDHVAPVVGAAQRGGLHQIRLRTFGLPESTVNDRLDGLEAAHAVTVAYRAHFPEIEVKLLARAPTDEEAKQRARRAADDARGRLGDVVFGEGATSLAEAVGSLCKERGLTFGTAESCTGGLVAELITDVSGSSAYFTGAVVSYSNDVKTRVLGVDAALLAAHGAVSPEVARAMADGARAVLGADVALSLTGIAGPTGGSEDKPVGLVHFAVATSEGISDRRIVYPGSRDRVRRLSAFAGLSLVRQVLNRGHE